MDGFRYSVFLTKDRGGRAQARTAVGLEPVLRQRRILRRRAAAGLVLVQPAAIFLLVPSGCRGIGLRATLRRSLAVLQRWSSIRRKSTRIDELAAKPRKRSSATSSAGPCWASTVLTISVGQSFQGRSALDERLDRAPHRLDRQPCRRAHEPVNFSNGMFLATSNKSKRLLHLSYNQQVSLEISGAAGTMWRRCWRICPRASVCWRIEQQDFMGGLCGGDRKDDGECATRRVWSGWCASFPIRRRTSGL